MPQHRNLTFSDEAIAIMDAEGPKGALGEWISEIIVSCFAATNGIVLDASCGELGSISPALTTLLRQNAMILAELEKLRRSQQVLLNR